MSLRKEGKDHQKKETTQSTLLMMELTCGTWVTIMNLRKEGRDHQKKETTQSTLLMMELTCGTWVTIMNLRKEGKDHRKKETTLNISDGNHLWNLGDYHEAK